MGVTIKDIAKIANVSHTTVSRALNDSPYIKKETKDYIKQLAKEMNYITNYNAKGLVLQKSYNIGLFFTTLEAGTSAYFFHEVVRKVHKIIGSQYNLSINGIDTIKNYESINSKKYDGIILMSQSVEDDECIKAIINQEIPIVVLNREVEDLPVVNIVSDDKQGAFNATEKLISLGHKDIAIIEGKEKFKSTIVRREGVEEAFHKNNVELNGSLVKQGDYSYESGYIAMKDLLKENSSYTAVLCFNDDMAIGAMKAIKENNLRVPEDISVIGFDDNIIGQFSTPTLTTVRRKIGTISKIGAETLLKLIHKEDVKPEKIAIQTELVCRESMKESPM